MLANPEGWGLEPFSEAEDLAYTASVLGEQREAALRRHVDDGWGFCVTCFLPKNPYQRESYPCPTAQDLGVTG
jgi:hypothetical protein